MPYASAVSHPSCTTVRTPITATPIARFRAASAFVDAAFRGSRIVLTTILSLVCSAGRQATCLRPRLPLPDRAAGVAHHEQSSLERGIRRPRHAPAVASPDHHPSIARDAARRRRPQGIQPGRWRCGRTDLQCLVLAMHVGERRRGGTQFDQMKFAHEERVVACLHFVDRAGRKPTRRAFQQP